MWSRWEQGDSCLSNGDATGASAVSGITSCEFFSSSSSPRSVLQRIPNSLLPTSTVSSAIYMVNLLVVVDIHSHYGREERTELELDLTLGSFNCRILCECVDSTTVCLSLCMTFHVPFYSILSFRNLSAVLFVFYFICCDIAFCSHLL